jgi:multiple sugar transport system permease protein
MSSTQQVLAAGPPAWAKGPWRPPGHRHLRDSDFRWAIAFVSPYAAVFFAFVIYPFGYALWMASKPSLYADLIADPSYLQTVINTLLFVGLGVNVKMFLALLLSGFFMRRRWWIRALLVVFILPWAVAAAQACVSFHWMLIGEPRAGRRRIVGAARHRRPGLVRSPLARARIEHYRLYLEMDAVLDRDLPCRPDEDSPRNL